MYADCTLFIKDNLLGKLPDNGRPLTAEVLALVADDGRLGDFRIGLAGTEKLAVRFSTKHVYASSQLPGTELSFHIRPEDIKISTNSTVSQWYDLNTLVKAREIIANYVEDEDDDSEDLLTILDGLEGDGKEAAIRWAIDAAENGLELVLQGLPASGEKLNSHPVFRG